MKKIFEAVANIFRTDPDRILDSGFTRLQRAIIENNLSAAVSLIKAGADVNFRGALVCPPLHFALQRDCHDIAIALMQSGADVNLQDADGQAPLHKAAFRGQAAFVHALLRHGANPNVADQNGVTPLHVASATLPELVDTLASQKANVNAQDADGNTPMHRFLDKPAIIERLLANGGDPNVRNKAGFSPYMMMLEEDRFQRYHKVLQQMLNFKADVAAANQLGETVLHLAARLEMQDTFNAAFTAAELGARDQNDNNVLHALARAQNVSMIARVLARAPDLLHQQNKQGLTPLAELARRADRPASKMDDRFVATAKLMIRNGADPSVADDKGRTLLHHAASQEKTDFLEFLLAAKIKPDLVDNDGRAALHIAIEKGLEKKDITLLDMLLDHGANPDLTDARGWTVLDRLAERGDRDSPVVQRLIVGAGTYQKQLPLNPDQMRKKEQNGLGKDLGRDSFGKPGKTGGFGIR